MSESEKGGLELTALGYLARRVPVLGPILTAGDDAMGEHYWHDEQRKQTRRASKKFRRTARIAVPAILAALFALDAYVWRDYRENVRINSRPQEAHMVSNKEKRFYFRFINIWGASYCLAVDISGEPTAHSASRIVSGENELLREFLYKMYPVEATHYKKETVSSRNPELQEKVREAVKRNPDLRKYCPKELLHE